MKQDQSIHEPKQKRSALTREKIVDTSRELFCKKGYYQVSTNEIARAANISIGNLYFYFPNKETIFLEILDRYHQSFLKIHEGFLRDAENSSKDLKHFLRGLMEMIIKNHENSRELNREIQILSLSDPAVAALLEKQQEQTEVTVFRYFEKYRDQLQVQDLEAAAAITFSLINSVVDQIAFSKNKINRKRLLTETVNAVEIYLLGK
ncbi:Bacterial regulatory proteins, tetR family [Caprobacter fermentans]|uniref:Bacterial regulatory proteins, tetR family n=1 Tax=Caproicibacter fermentans TaxID=2576756 RepID=A0A6N8I298_9FIRM|nr:Bacterial regulatory proteins, tetR family [Caproicibacter fermentans]OCN03038.1 TetR family transcriptional regulator [Clostridium sp. W14A]